MENKVYVGIDVAKDTFCVDTCPSLFKTTLPNTSEGHRKLCKALKKYTIALVVMEATGGYERPLSAELLNASLPVTLKALALLALSFLGAGAFDRLRRWRVGVYNRRSDLRNLES